MAKQEMEDQEFGSKVNVYYNRYFTYSVHEMTNDIMVKVMNTVDDALIREIPSEKLLDILGHLWDVVGLLVDEKL